MSRYIVPLQIPKYCNKCDFSRPWYSHPWWAKAEESDIDGQVNPIGTAGYVCNVEFYKNRKYTKVISGQIGENIPKPEWCELMEEAERSKES